MNMSMNMKEKLTHKSTHISTNTSMNMSMDMNMSTNNKDKTITARAFWTGSGNTFFRDVYRAGQDF